MKNLHKRAASARLIATLVPAFLTFAFSTGCRSNCELVERQNHQLEVALREARAEVMHTQAYNDALQRELAAIRVTPPAERPLPEVGAQHYSLKSIVLARQTGGINTDGHLGDDALQVVFEPQDVDGHAIKAPGALFVELSEINTEGNKRPISTWFVAPEQLRSRWKSGLFTTGYFVTLPWRTWPDTEKLRVAVKFTLADGRTLEDEKTVTIKPRPASQRKLIPADPSDGPQIETPLPPPRKLEGSGSDGPRLESAAPRRPNGAGTQPAAPVVSTSATVTVELGTPETPR